MVYLTAWLEGSPVGNLCLILGGPGNPQARDGLPAGPEMNAFDVISSHLGYQDWPTGGISDSYTWTDDSGHEHEQEEVVIWMEQRLDDAI